MVSSLATEHSSNNTSVLGMYAQVFGLEGRGGQGGEINGIISLAHPRLIRSFNLCASPSGF